MERGKREGIDAVSVTCLAWPLVFPAACLLGRKGAGHSILLSHSESGINERLDHMVLSSHSSSEAFLETRSKQRKQTLFNDLRQDIALKKDNYIDLIALY